VYRALTAIETGLLNTPPAALGFEASGDDDAEENQRIEVEEGVHRLETLLEATVDKTFDRFEIYTLRNILRVPDGLEQWVRLQHYEVSGITHRVQRYVSCSEYQLPRTTIDCRKRGIPSALPYLSYRSAG